MTRRNQGLRAPRALSRTPQYLSLPLIHQVYLIKTLVDRRALYKVQSPLYQSEAWLCIWFPNSRRDNHAELRPDIAVIISPRWTSSMLFFVML